MTQHDSTTPPRRSDHTRTAILDAARLRFAEQGYERTTIRAVAADAAIDPSMVMRYFGNKEQLFDAALAVDLRLPDVVGLPREQVPAALIRHFLDRWENAPAADALLVLLRSAVTNPQAAARLHDVFATQVAPLLQQLLGPELAARRAGLVASQLLGLALTRCLIRLPAATRLTPDQIVEDLSPALRVLLSP